MGVPAERVRRCSSLPARDDGEYVLYWMIAARRAAWSFALQRAVEHAVTLGKPLVVLEALRAGYRWASERLHAFVIEGMSDNARAFEGKPVTYLPYVEPEPGAGKGLLEALAAQACVVVTDDAPVFFLPRAVAAAAGRLPVLLEAVDGSGLLPLAATDAVFPTAFAFRRLLQGVLPARLEEAPVPDPLAGVRLPSLPSLPVEVTRRWPAASPALLECERSTIAALPVGHRVGRVPEVCGGRSAGVTSLRRFLNEKLPRYHEARNRPEQEGTSGLSPYLHFGHVSAHEVFAAVAERERWTPDRLASKASGKRAGWWGMSVAAEAFLDQLVTWREVGFNFASKRDDGERYESLPPWARATLEKHLGDRRAHLYTPEQLEQAATHDPLWNAAQTQLLREGTIHNYLRMLWGKKIVEWSPRRDKRSR